MAIAFDASSVGHQDFGGTMTISHTCTGSNLVLVAMAANASSADKVSGVTYNGTAMTRVRAETARISFCHSLRLHSRCAVYWYARYRLDFHFGRPDIQRH
jgi:hypothetical protein